MEPLVTVLLIMLVISLTCFLPFSITALFLVLKERRKLTFRVEYVMGFDADTKGIEKATPHWQLTKTNIKHIKLDPKEFKNVPFFDKDEAMRKEAEVMMKERHPMFMHVRDVEIFEIDIINDGISGFKFSE